ncbi:hypothetical protein E4L95_23800 [Paracoccus liaowanqingii]|uniref:Uncharacterized protein n=1 Tax=Paracoccus liaowanqingii TaxID=2560053 RepID=A0A4Z1C3J6_9RHOB|nr:hypothetical protein [Paracoccus liaowanqingii]TGN31160.1 hypothetical protein E4L95_23800 [Paracoccus liaowanqingii]
MIQTFTPALWPAALLHDVALEEARRNGKAENNERLTLSLCLIVENRRVGAGNDPVKSALPRSALRLSRILCVFIQQSADLTSWQGVDHTGPSLCYVKPQRPTALHEAFLSKAWNWK